MTPKERIDKRAKEMHKGMNFENASEDFKTANPTLVNRWKSAVSLHRRAMNKTESEFALRLEAMKRAGEILRYEFEGITLRWADMRYTPDFVVFLNNAVAAINGLCLIEVKGGHIWSRDVVRFKGARAFWPEFSFEMWQKKGGTWKQKY